jgi:hypothetical protein
MSSRRKKDVFSKVKQVKSMSRAAIGTVPPTKVVPQGLDRARKETLKHPKRAIEKEIEGE